MDRYEEDDRDRAESEYGDLKDFLVLYVDGYEINQSRLSKKMEYMLDERLRRLYKYNTNDYVIICEGHACSLGSDEMNTRLGQSRAEEALNYLVRKGFDRNNLTAISKGKNIPIMPNTSEENRKINRRVVFLVKEKR